MSNQLRSMTRQAAGLGAAGPQKPVVIGGQTPDKVLSEIASKRPELTPAEAVAWAVEIAAWSVVAAKTGIVMQRADEIAKELKIEQNRLEKEQESTDGKPVDLHESGAVEESPQTERD